MPFPTRKTSALHARFIIKTLGRQAYADYANESERKLEVHSNKLEFSGGDKQKTSLAGRPKSLAQP